MLCWPAQQRVRRERGFVVAGGGPSERNLAIWGGSEEQCGRCDRAHRRNRGDVTGGNRALCPEEQQRSSQPPSAENCRSGHTSCAAFPRPVDPKATLSGTAGGIPARPLLRSQIRRAISSRSTAMCWASGPGRGREAQRKGSRLRSPLSLAPSSHQSSTSARLEPQNSALTCSTFATSSDFDFSSRFPPRRSPPCRPSSLALHPSHSSPSPLHR
ncbi:hypothetical protein AAT19DRAFT_10958 [Rhodotorula toruloides]|uniref:Uncharacterized protein n=1 Tax=Rhodotorula toruloides TaxID=5286 RepID=A0A2S9ZYK2_RHOTO|nr:hypothetical protein AAT19DRAFT_10958 [Rhodotorula toruloides]